ncbi:MAG: methyltransferase domain-containing protein [Armatimonas sp.]
MLESSDERFDKNQYGRFRCEHLHRYQLAAALARGKDVLDIASGEGYGSAALAQVARSVVGVDIAPDAVEHAARTYTQPSLRFLEGSCDAIPLSDASVDLIVSFETIEHHDRHEEMMVEFRRILRPGGLVLLSSPNRDIYSADHVNPFHVRELSRAELSELLGRHFAHVQITGQRSWLVSLAYGESGPARLTSEGPLPEPEYFLSLASDTPLPDGLPTEIFFDTTDDAMERMEHLFTEQTGAYKNLESEYTRQEKANQETRQELTTAYQHLEGEYLKLKTAHQELAGVYTPLEHSYFALEEQLRGALARITELEQQLDAVRQTPAYKMGKRLGLAPSLDKEPPA